MNQKASWRIWIRRIIQLIGRALLVIVLLLMLAPLLVNFKPIRKKIVSKTSSRIEAFTQANFSISDFRIIFPLGLRLESLSYNDSLSVADIDVLQMKIRAFSRRNNRIKVAVKIEGADVRLYTSTFKSFSGNNKNGTKTKKEKVSWELGASLDGDNLSFVFNQDDTLQLVNASVKHIKARNLVFETLENNLSWQLVEIDTACTSILLGPSAEEEIEKVETKADWNFSGRNVRLKAVDFELAQQPNGLFLASSVSSLTLKSPLVDLANKTISVDNLTVEGVKYMHQIPLTFSEGIKTETKEDFPWVIQAKKASLVEIDFFQELFYLSASGAVNSAQNMSISGFKTDIKDALLSHQQAKITLDNLGLIYNEIVSIDKSSISFKSDDDGTAAQVLLNSGESKIQAEIKSEENANKMELAFPLPEHRLKIQITNLEPKLVKQFLSDSLKAQLQYFTTPISIQAQTHASNNWFELDTCLIELEDLLNFSAHLGFDQYENTDSIIYRGNTALNIKKELLKAISIANSSAYESGFFNEDYLLEGEVLGTFSSIHLRQLLTADFVRVPIDASYYAFDSSFTASFQNFMFEADSLLNLPLKIEKGDLEFSGSYRVGEEINFSVQFSEYSLLDTDLSNLLLKGKLKDDFLQGILLTNDSLLQANVEYQLIFSDLISAQAKGEFNSQQKVVLFGDSIIGTQSNFSAQYRSDEAESFKADIILSEIILATKSKKYSYDEIEFSLNSQPEALEIKLESDIVHGDFLLNQNLDSLVSWLQGESYFTLFTDTASVRSFVTRIPQISLNFDLHSDEFIENIILGKKLSFDYFKASIVSNENERVKTRFVGKGLKFKDSNIGRIEMSTEVSENSINLIGEVSQLESSNLQMNNVKFDSRLFDGVIHNSFSGMDELGDTRFHVDFDLINDTSGFTFSLPKESAVTFGEVWQIAPNSRFHVSPQGVYSGSVRVNSSDTKLELGRTNNCPYALNLENYEIDKLGGLFELSNKLGGVLHAQICINDSAHKEIQTKVEFNNLEIDGELLGNYGAKGYLKIEDSTAFVFEASVNRNSSELMSVSGSINRTEPVLSKVELFLSEMEVSHLASFFDEYVNDLEGKLNGRFLYDGQDKQSVFKGGIAFAGLKVNPTALNSDFTFSDDTVLLNNRTVSLTNLTIYDSYGKSLHVGGFIEMPSNKDPQIRLNIKGDSMQIMNIAETPTNEFFGRVVASSDFQMKGDLKSPKTSLDLKFINGTDFTFRIIENLDSYEGEGVIEFVSHDLDNSLEDTVSVFVSQAKGLDMNARIIIDPKTKFNLIYDQNMFFEINLLGRGDLNYISDKLGNESMTGQYKVERGNSVLKLQGLPPRNFRILPKSFVRWDGLVTDPLVDINAYYTTKGSYSNPVSGAEQTIVVDYEVLFAIKNRMSDPKIIFDVRTDDEYMTTVLNMMTEEERIKQAINLLLLGQIVTPETKITGASVLTDHLNQFWSQQLNDAASKNMEGVRVSVDINTYSAYSSSGGTQDQTDLSYEVSKDVWNDRATVKVGGYVRTGTQSPDEAMGRLIGDVSLEYQLNKDKENLYGKVFSKNKYEGILEGEIQTTGVGILYRQNYTELSEIWHRRQNRKAKKKDAKDNE